MPYYYAVYRKSDGSVQTTGPLKATSPEFAFKKTKMSPEWSLIEMIAVAADEDGKPLTYTRSDIDVGAV